MVDCERRTIRTALRDIGLGTAEKVSVPKWSQPTLPDRFDEYYPAKGMQNDGAVASYRDGREHAIEYDDHWKIHIDDVDPEKQPLAHAIQDAPKATAAALVISGLIIHKYK